MTDAEKVEFVRAAIKKNPKLLDGWKLLSKRKRGRGVITYRTFYRTLKDKFNKIWDKDQIDDFFTLAEKAGVGRIVAGRDTKVFYWEVHLQEMAEAIVSGKKPPEQIRPATPPRNPLRKPFEESSVRKVNTYVRPTSSVESDPELIKLVNDFLDHIDVEKLSPKAAVAYGCLMQELRKRR